VIDDRTVDVSVIVPVYKTESRLRRCLDSLVHQTLRTIEIIVVNDGSPDQSQAIIDEYSQRFPQTVRGLLKPNGGLSDARNFGIQRAIGEYLAFVDSDDYVELDMLERLHRKAVDSGAEVVCCPVTKVHEDRNLVVRDFFLGTEAFGDAVRKKPEVLLFANSYAWNKIYKRSLWTEHGFRFPFGQWYEDSHTIYNVMLMANKIECVNIPLYNYLKGRDGTITVSVGEKIFDVFKSCDSIIAFYQQHGAFEDAYSVLESVCLRHLMARVWILDYAGNRDLADRFVETLHAYLDEHFPTWKSARIPRAPRGMVRRFLRDRAVKSSPLLRLYLRSRPAPRAMKRSLSRAMDLPRNLTRGRRRASSISSTTGELRGRRIQEEGLRTLSLVQALLAEEGIESFADFGTLLGIVREGRLLSHDGDLDLGVLLGAVSAHRVRVILEPRGFRVIRQYLLGDRLVQESYEYGGIRVDLNYYEASDASAKTWLFYRKPGTRYASNQRHVVEMTYSPIGRVKTVDVDGSRISIPWHAERLLEEKYGRGWRVPDTAWIYWRSPAATPLEEMGHFYTHRYRRLTDEWEPLRAESKPDKVALIRNP
jgi:glycosyltransferase involved in cell wall biosynthesis